MIRPSDAVGEARGISAVSSASTQTDHVITYLYGLLKTAPCGTAPPLPP